MPLKFMKFKGESDPPVNLITGEYPLNRMSEKPDGIVRIGLMEFLTGGQMKGIFVMRVYGEAMAGEIDDGDLIVISQREMPDVGDIIVARVNGSFTLKKFGRKNLNGKNIPQGGGNDSFEIFAVVTHVLKKFNHRVS